MIVEPPQTFNIYESYVISTCYGQSMENKPNKVISKMVLTHLLKRWDENNTQSHLSFIDMTSEEHISIKVCCIIIK